MPSEVTVRGRSNLLIGVFVAVFALILAAAPIGSGIVRAGWVMVMLGLTALVIVRSVRMSVSAGRSGLLVRNFGRNYRVPWDDVIAIDAGRSDNVSGAVTAIEIRRVDGSTLIGRGASSYSKPKVERWRDQLIAVQQSRT